MPTYHSKYGSIYIPSFYEFFFLGARACEIDVVDVDYVDLSEPQPISDPARLLPAYYMPIELEKLNH